MFLVSNMRSLNLVYRKSYMKVFATTDVALR